MIQWCYSEQSCSTHLCNNWKRKLCMLIDVCSWEIVSFVIAKLNASQRAVVISWLLLGYTGHFRYSHLLGTDTETHGEFSEGARIWSTQHWYSIVVCYHPSRHYSRPGILVRRRLPRQPVSSTVIHVDIAYWLLCSMSWQWINQWQDLVGDSAYLSFEGSSGHKINFKPVILPWETWQLKPENLCSPIEMQTHAGCTFDSCLTLT